ncbi:GGDEF domain-containing protein [Eubacteriaceae bacterium ES2]|nr:GGDEF domain-containing protein [Eubacteriaceae bacterium ES2]
MKIEKEIITTQPNSVLLQVYSANSDPNFLEKVIFIIVEKLPEINIVGTTTCGEVFNCDLSMETTILTFSVFEKSEIIIEEYDLEIMSEENAGERLLQTISNTKYVKGIQIFSASASNNLPKFLNTITSTNEEYPIFGAIAGVYSDFNTILPKIFTRQIYKNGIIAVIFTGNNLTIKVDYGLGWIPLGKEMVVTETDGELCIAKIDGLPAVSIYQKYLKVSPDKFFIENTCEFPLTIMRNGHVITRAPYGYDDDGKLYFTADIHKGESIRLSYGNPRNILHATKELSAKMRIMDAQALFLFACGNRLALLGAEAIKEVSSYKTVAQNVNGFYAFTEIARFGGKGGILNTAIVAIGMREGQSDNNFNSNIASEQAKNLAENAVPFTERLLNFLESVTEELNLSNERLKILSTIDSLTGLINRRKIEEVFDYEMSKRCRRKLAVILIDIDHFKKINDNFGHDIGDLVLKSVANKLLKALRQGDSVGRWGGEEFIMLLPETNLKCAREVAERVRQLIETSIFENVGTLTISLGVTAVIENEDKETIFKRADQALYLAKNNGRNRTEIL